MINIFQKKEIDAAFLYKGNWWELYDKISNSDSYSPHRTELELIDKNREKLQHHITKYLTDIGCGNWEKAIHILDGHHSINQISYIASDYSSSMIDIAENNIVEKIPDIKLWNHQIMRPWNELFTNKLDDNTYLRVGCTIWNFANREKIIEQLRSMNNSGMLKGNKIIFSYFDSPNSEEEIEEIKKLYDNKEWHDFIMNAVQNLWLNTSDFDAFVDYDKKENCAYMWIKPQKDIHIKLDSKTISVKEWEFYPLEKSKRFSKSEIEEILKEAWAKIEDHISENWISIVVAKKDPKYYHKTMKIMWLTGLLLLWTLAWWVWWYQISDYNQKKKAKKNVAEKIKQHDINIKFEWSQVWRMSSLEDKTHYLNSVADALISAYGKWNISKEDIFYMIVDNFDDDSFTYQSKGKDKFQKLNFINQKVIPHHKVQLQNKWVNMEPYLDLLEYEDAFKNSYLDTTNIKIKETALDLQFTGANIDPQEVHKIWEYVSINGSTYDIGYILRDFKIQNWKSDHYSWLYGLNWATIKSKKYLVARYKTDPSLWFQDKFSVENGKSLCEDYFLWTRPQIQFAYDMITTICRSEEATYISEDQCKSILDILTEYFIKNNISRDNISKFQNNVYPSDWLNLVYQKILPDNEEKFRKIWINPQPYDIFNQYADAFKNSENYHNEKHSLDKDISLATYKDLVKYDYKYIWNYITQEWRSYSVLYVTIDDRKYILASETNGHYPDTEPSINDWLQVRQDFKSNRLKK